jgi:hypothetical protein
MRRGVAPLALCDVLDMCACAATQHNLTLNCSMCVCAVVQHTLTLDCCTVLNQLYTYMKVTDAYKCTSPDTGCASVKLVQQLVNHTKAAMHGSSMHTQGSDIVLSMQSNHNLEDLFVFAFFGRIASPAESTEVDLWLSYNTKHKLIVFEDSTCNYNRNVYTLLVLSSIILLMFFIGVQVVRNNERNTEKDGRVGC